MLSSPRWNGCWRSGAFKSKCERAKSRSLRQAFGNGVKRKIVIAAQEADTEEAVSVSVKGADGAELLSVAMAALLVELLERLPAETRPSFEPFLASLKQMASRPI
jgi:hypothetical protein